MNDEALWRPETTRADATAVNRYRAFVNERYDRNLDSYAALHQWSVDQFAECLSSISGGTDLVGCLVAGNPAGAVYRGECQVPTLGMDIAVYDDKGDRLQGEMGEIFCATPFPSIPLGFWKSTAPWRLCPKCWKPSPSVRTAATIPRVREKCTTTDGFYIGIRTNLSGKIGLRGANCV